MKRKKNHGEEQENSDRWLLTYADLITLLLGLFVILYAMSKIDSEKYSQIINAFEGMFGSGKTIVASSSSGLTPLQQERLAIESALKQALGTDLKHGTVFVTNDERGVTIHILEELLFESGKADLKKTSLHMLDTIAAVLRTIPNDIRVEGHTDDVPIKTATYPSNWHLSVARAVNTGFYLITKHELRPERVSVVGYAEFRPLVPNTSEENRARNRRVDIVIVTNIAHGAPNSNGEQSKDIGSKKESSS